MHIGQRIITKHEEKVQEGIIIDTYKEDLKIKLDSGDEVFRKYWEVNKIKNQ